MRGSLSPHELVELTDRLVADPDSIWASLGLHPGSVSQSDSAIIYCWINILEDARDLELMQAPSLSAYVGAGISTSLAIAGLGVGLSGPLAPVTGAVALAVGGISGLFAFYQAGQLVHKDGRTGERLRAIDHAIKTLDSLVK